MPTQATFAAGQEHSEEFRAGVRRVAIWVRVPTHFLDMLRVARFLNRQPDYDPCMVFPYWFEGIEPQLEVCRKEGVRYLAHHAYTGMHEFLPGADEDSGPAIPVHTEPCRAAVVAPEPIRVPEVVPVAVPTVSLPSEAASPVVPAVSVVSSATGRAENGLVKRLAKGIFSWETRNYLRELKARALQWLQRRVAFPIRWFLALVCGVVSAIWHLIHPRELVLKLRAAPNALMQMLLNSRPLRRFYQAVSEVRSQRQLVTKLVDHLRPALVVLAEDNVELETGPLIQVARQRGVPAVVLPYTIGNVREAAESYFDLPEVQRNRFVNRLLGFIWPQWLLMHRGRRLLRLSGWRAFARQAAGIAPPLPWVLNSGRSAAIAVESEAQFNGSLKAGLPREQLVVLGSLRLDDVARNLDDRRARVWRLLAEHGLPRRPHLILCALPPNQNPATRPGCQFNEYSDLVDFWLDTFDQLSSCNVLINPHPRCSPRDVKRLEERGACVVRGDIARLIPLCDVYVASVSATITMAVAAGKPVVNYDVYCYHYGDFDGCPLVETVRMRWDFRKSLERALNRVAIARPNAHWGQVDGRSGERLLALFEALLAGKEIPAAAWQPYPSPECYHREPLGRPKAILAHEPAVVAEPARA